MSDGRPDTPDPSRDRARFAKELASGIGMVAFILWITFFSTAGFVEIATLAVAVAMLIWFATVEPERLMDGPRRPSSMLFLLASLACAVVLTATLIFGTATMFLVTILTFGAVVVGLVRALGHRYRQKPEVEDGIL